MSFKAYAVQPRDLAQLELPSTPQSALIIGNNQYEEGKLSYSVHNAKDIAKALEDKGFDIILKTNLNRRKMDDAIRDFSERRMGKSTKLFYFSNCLNPDLPD